MIIPYIIKLKNNNITFCHLYFNKFELKIRTLNSNLFFFPFLHWNGLNLSNQTKVDRTEPKCTEQTKMDQTDFRGLNRPKWTKKTEWIKLDHTDRIRLSWVNRTRLERNGPNRQKWNELDRTELKWTEWTKIWPNVPHFGRLGLLRLYSVQFSPLLSIRSVWIQFVSFQSIWSVRSNTVRLV